MFYLVPFSILKSWLATFEANDHSGFDLPYGSFIGLVRRLLAAVPVDETWYLTEYPGVAAGMQRGHIPSARQHFLMHGYFEQRNPYSPNDATRRQPVKFSDLQSLVEVRPARSGLRVHLTPEGLTELLRRVLDVVPIDEAWYCQIYPGVARAIEAGNFASATSHFAQYGYREGRLPFQIQVDEVWYKSRYHDVATQIAEGTVTSAQDHFDRFGYREGRFPAATEQTAVSAQPRLQGAA